MSAALTFAILCLFALVVGAVAEQRIRTSFDDDLRATAADLQDQITVKPDAQRHPAARPRDQELLQLYAAGGAVVRVINLSGGRGLSPRRVARSWAPGEGIARRRATCAWSRASSWPRH